jgi:hypothetical protein
MAANFASHPIISVLPDNHRYLSEARVTNRHFAGNASS